MQTMEAVAQFAGTLLVAGLWQGMVLAAAVWLCLRLAPRTSAAMRYAVWLGVLGVIALLPVVEAMAARHGTGLAASSMAAINLNPRWSLGLAAVWGLVSAVGAVRLGVQAVRLGSLARRATVVHSGCAAGLLVLGRRRVLLCSSDEVDRPSVIGFFQPRILIPAWLLPAITEEELRQIVLHEMEHLRRGDDWLNLLQKLSLVMMPLHPALLWVERRLCVERELACDDGVLARTNAPRAYATCLTNLAERGLDRRLLALALGALERQSELGRRVHRILRREASLTPKQSRVVTAAVGVVLFGGAAGLARCPQLVAFRAAQPIAMTARAEGRVAAVPTAAALPLLGNADVPARVERVAYREGSGAKARMLTVAQPVVRQAAGESAGSTALQTAAPVRRSPRTRRVARGDTGRSGWVVLTSWSEERHPRAMVPVGVDADFFHSYAAVPVDGGWLIVQL